MGLGFEGLKGDKGQKGEHGPPGTTGPLIPFEGVQHTVGPTGDPGLRGDKVSDVDSFNFLVYSIA